MDVTVENLEPMRVAFIRHVGPYDQVGGTWGKLMGWVGRHGLFGPNTRMLGVCHDDPEVTPPERLRSRRAETGFRQVLSRRSREK